MCLATAASSSAAGTTSWTRPISLARAAEKRAPFKHNSRAAETPILRTTYGEIIAGKIPSVTSVNPKIASSAATTTSQIAARPAPPPSAAPWIAADHRHRHRVERLEHHRRLVRVGEVLFAGVPGHLRHPLDDRRRRRTPGPAPCRTTARIAPSARTPRAQAVSSRNRGVVECVSDVGTIEGDGRDRTGADGDRGHGYIRKTPNRASATGALNAAESPSASASRVRAGSRMPSSQSRAVE